MKEYLSKDIRNVVLLGHSGSGKTALVESALFKTKAIDRMGKTTDGTAAMDYDPEEAKRGLSVFTAVAPIEWKNTKINILDTPGYLDYEGEKVSGAAVADLAVVVVSAKEGIESGTESAVKLCKKNNLPIVFFINKIDDDNANFEKTVDDLRSKFGSSVVPFEVPVMEGHKMTGSAKVLDDSSNPHYDQISEAIASADDELMEKFFMEEPLTPEEIAKGLKAGIVNGDIYPVYACSGYNTDAVDLLLNGIVASAPDATHAAEGDIKVDESAPVAAVCFKTIDDRFGKMSFFKVISGKISSAVPAYNSRTENQEKIGKMISLKEEG